MHTLENGLTLLQTNPHFAADLTEGKYHGWLFTKNHDGKWITARKLSKFEINQAEDQRDSGIVIQSQNLRF